VASEPDALLIAQLLIGVSFAVASYQDIRERAVSDVVWIPALIGAAYVIYSFFPNLELQLVKLGLIGGIAILFAFLGAVGQADSIAIVFLASDPYQLSPILPLVSGAVVALAHIGYEVAVGNARSAKIIPLERFLKEQKWIPKAVIEDGVRRDVDSDVNVARDEVEATQKPGAMVEVKYGVPTVAYLGVGYIAFLAYLLVFNQSAFLSLP
jgi:Flp pilus assembly protein protease CpaA